MRQQILLAPLLLAALAVAAAAAAANSAPPDARPPAPTLRGAQCLDPDMARSFVTLGDRVLLVDAGHYRYRIEVSPSCWNLDFTPVVAFRGDPVMNRVCGSAFDAVLVRDGHPCRIERMEMLSTEQYKQALREGSELRKARRAARKAKSGTP